jgi:hypothetical protein
MEPLRWRDAQSIVTAENQWGWALPSQNARVPRVLESEAGMVELIKLLGYICLAVTSVVVVDGALRGRGRMTLEVGGYGGVSAEG